MGPKDNILHLVKFENLSNFSVENSDSNTTELSSRISLKFTESLTKITKIVNLKSRFVADRNFCASEIFILEKIEM